MTERVSNVSGQTKAIKVANIVKYFQCFITIKREERRTKKKKSKDQIAASLQRYCYFLWSCIVFFLYIRKSLERNNRCMKNKARKRYKQFITAIPFIYNVLPWRVKKVIFFSYSFNYHCSLNHFQTHPISCLFHSFNLT